MLRPFPLSRSLFAVFAMLLMAVAVGCAEPTPTPTPTPTATPTVTPTPTATPSPTPTVTPTPTPAPERTSAEVVKQVYDLVTGFYDHHLGYIREERALTADAKSWMTGEDRLQLLDYEAWLDAYETDVKACTEGIEGGIKAEWEPDSRTWRVTYLKGDREVVYRWFERLEMEGKNPLELVEGCQTVPIEWEYQVWRE